MHQGSDEPRLGLLWALGVSVLLHLLLILLGSWLPVLSTPAVATPAEDTLLHFAFEPEAQDETQDVPRGETPLPTPATRPSRDGEPVPPGPAEAQAEPPVPGLAAPEPEPQPQPETSDEPPAAPEERPQSVHAPPPRSADAQAIPPPARDMERALREFRRTQDSRPDEAGRPPVPGGLDWSRFVPDPAELPLSGAPFYTLEFESRDFDWSDYARQIYFAILRAWYERLYRTTADFERWAHGSGDWWLDHRARIRFVIEGSGDVTGIRLEAGSGCEPLDRSALDALDEVVLPPLPPDFPRGQEAVHATFLARIEVSVMRQQLGGLKRAGYF
jgi:TonB family protein